MCFSPSNRVLAKNYHSVTIKAEPLEDRRKIVYEREYENLQFPQIVASPYIRALENCIGHEEKMEQRCMVLEWMDTDLWKARFNPRNKDPELQKNIPTTFYTDLLSSEVSTSQIVTKTTNIIHS
jgi:hypothetical protein